mmetsp:Transcript_109050/g.260184  ORF Transcript_109050/g.260184 Transcript_109050/m.260184 type:complete len:235 (+) Transcript_109050:1068-1772(+)
MEESVVAVMNWYSLKPSAKGLGQSLISSRCNGSRWLSCLRKVVGRQENLLKERSKTRSFCRSPNCSNVSSMQLWEMRSFESWCSEEKSGSFTSSLWLRLISMMLGLTSFTKVSMFLEAFRICSRRNSKVRGSFIALTQLMSVNLFFAKLRTSMCSRMNCLCMRPCSGSPTSVSKLHCGPLKSTRRRCREDLYEVQSDPNSVKKTSLPREEYCPRAFLCEASFMAPATCSSPFQG